MVAATLTLLSLVTQSNIDAQLAAIAIASADKANLLAPKMKNRRRASLAAAISAGTIAYFEPKRGLQLLERQWSASDPSHKNLLLLRIASIDPERGREKIPELKSSPWSDLTDNYYISGLARKNPKMVAGLLKGKQDTAREVVGDLMDEDPDGAAKLVIMIEEVDRDELLSFIGSNSYKRYPAESLDAIRRIKDQKKRDFAMGWALEDAGSPPDLAVRMAERMKDPLAQAHTFAYAASRYRMVNPEKAKITAERAAGIVLRIAEKENAPLTVYLFPEDLFSVDTQGARTILGQAEKWARSNPGRYLGRDLVSIGVSWSRIDFAKADALVKEAFSIDPQANSGRHGFEFHGGYNTYLVEMTKRDPERVAKFLAPYWGDDMVQLLVGKILTTLLDTHPVQLRRLAALLPKRDQPYFRTDRTVEKMLLANQALQDPQNAYPALRKMTAIQCMTPLGYYDSEVVPRVVVAAAPRDVALAVRLASTMTTPREQADVLSEAAASLWAKPTIALQLLKASAVAASREPDGEERAFAWANLAGRAKDIHRRRNRSAPPRNNR